MQPGQVNKIVLHYHGKFILGIQMFDKNGVKLISTDRYSNLNGFNQRVITLKDD